MSYCQPSQLKVRMNLETYCLKDYGGCPITGSGLGRKPFESLNVVWKTYNLNVKMWFHQS